MAGFRPRFLSRPKLKKQILKTNKKQQNRKMKKLILLASLIIGAIAVNAQTTIKMANANGCTAVPVTTTGTAYIFADVSKYVYAITGQFAVKSNTASYAASGLCGAGTVGSAHGICVPVVSNDGTNWIALKTPLAPVLSTTSIAAIVPYRYLNVTGATPDTVYQGSVDSSATAGSNTYMIYKFPTGYRFVGFKYTGTAATGATISGTLQAK